MYYMLVFVGLVGMAAIVAISPLVIRVLEYFFPLGESDHGSARGAGPHSVQRSEVHDEIRRLTAALETNRRSERKS